MTRYAWTILTGKHMLRLRSINVQDNCGRADGEITTNTGRLRESRIVNEHYARNKQPYD